MIAVTRMQASEVIVPVLAWIACWLGACTTASGAGGGGETLTVAAAIQPSVVPPGEAIVIWQVTSDSSDYGYVWGRTPVNAGRFRLSLDAPPPPAAMNSYGLGVGLVATTAATATLDDGKLPDRFDLSQLTGLSAHYAIVYADHQAALRVLEANADSASREELDEAMHHWMFDFPAGYSCGIEVPAVAGEVFDTFAPTKCANVQVDQGDVATFQITNWT